MATQPVNLSDGLGETVLPVEPAELVAAVEAAATSGDPVAALDTVTADWPRSPLCWASVGDNETSTMRRYAAYRVGYHRGLDALRANGWRGSGYVRWGRGGNDGFLRCLAGLQEMAVAIGEVDEADRTAQFLIQLDPAGRPGGDTGQRNL